MVPYANFNLLKFPDKAQVTMISCRRSRPI
jgi:hypothetical protein